MVWNSPLNNGVSRTDNWQNDVDRSEHQLRTGRERDSKMCPPSLSQVACHSRVTCRSCVKCCAEPAQRSKSDNETEVGRWTQRAVSVDIEVRCLVRAFRMLVQNSRNRRVSVFWGHFVRRWLYFRLARVKRPKIEELTEPETRGQFYAFCKQRRM